MTRKNLLKSILDTRYMINRILNELITRTIINLNNQDSLIYQEFLNNLFVTNENLRNIINDNINDNLYNSFVLEQIYGLIYYNSLFTSKWNLGYSSWLSSFKSKRINHSAISTGDSYSHINYQIQFPNLTELDNDIDRYEVTLKEMIYELNYYDDNLKSLHDNLSKNIMKRIYYKLFTRNTINLPESKKLNDLRKLTIEFSLIDKNKFSN